MRVHTDTGRQRGVGVMAAPDKPVEVFSADLL